VCVCVCVCECVAGHSRMDMVETLYCYKTFNEICMNYYF